MIYKMDLKDSSDTMTFNLLETPIVDKDIEGAVDNVTLDGNQYTDYLYLKKQYIQKWAIMCPDEYDELRGFYTRQFEDGEVPSYRVYYGANVTRDYTLNGDYFQFNAEGIETGMTLSQLLGNAEQTTYSGKNLFDFGKFISDNVSVQGVVRGTATYTSNSITLTATSNDCFTKYGFSPSLYPVIPVPQNTDVTLSWKTNNTSGTNRGVVYVFGNDNGATAVIKYVQDRSGYCAFNTGSYTEISFRVGVAASGDTLTYSDIQVEIGSAPTAYEKFVGGIPAPNPQFPQPISTVTGAQTVVVTGKNLLDTSDPHDKSGSGMTATWNNGVVEVKGTNAATSFPLSDNIALPTQIKAGTEISASFVGASIGNTIFRFFNQATSQYELLSVANHNTSGTYTLTRDADAVQLYKGGVPTNTYKEFSISNWQIEYGSTATSYEPYQSQSYEVNLGKNLFDASNTNTLALGTNTLVTNAAYRGYTLKAISGATYTLSRASTSTPPRFRVCFTKEIPAAGVSYYDQYGSLGVSINADSLASTTFTVPSDMRYIFIYLSNNGTLINESMKIQLERGSRATTYAPYFTPIELAKVGTYQDRIYKNEGKWYIEKNVGKLVFDSTNASSIMQNPSNPNRYLNPSGSTIFTGLALSLPSFQSYCSHYTFVRNGTAWQGVGKCGFDPTGTFWLMDSTTNLSTLRAWLASEGVYIYYPLATPTTTEITNETLRAQLNFLASLYKGENNISLVGTGAQGEMEVFIRDVMSVETDVVPEVPVRLTLTDDGVINACGCRRNVQLTMRETTE